MGPGMIVVNSEGAAFVGVALWWIGAWLFASARRRGALTGTGWMALGCGIFGAIQGVMALDFTVSGEVTVIAMVGMSWAAGSAAFCFGLWQWTLSVKERHGY